jgi:hypothetical protein
MNGWKCGIGLPATVPVLAHNKRASSHGMRKELEASEQHKETRDLSLRKKHHLLSKGGLCVSES